MLNNTGIVGLSQNLTAYQQKLIFLNWYLIQKSRNLSIDSALHFVFKKLCSKNRLWMRNCTHLTFLNNFYCSIVKSRNKLSKSYKLFPLNIFFQAVTLEDPPGDEKISKVWQIKCWENDLRRAAGLEWITIVRTEIGGNLWRRSLSKGCGKNRSSVKIIMYEQKIC